MDLLKKLDKHFVAAAAATVVAGGAQAAIVYSGVVNISIPVNIDGVYMNLVTGATGTAGGSVAGWDINPYSASALTWFNAVGTGMVRGVGGSTSLVDNLAPGYLISSTSPNYGGGSSESTGPTAFVFNSSNNIVGFRFLNETTGATNYGWARINLGASFIDPARKIVEYAYDDSGAAITAGTIPAPGAIALLGLAGLAGRRRRA